MSNVKHTEVITLLESHIDICIYREIGVVNKSSGVPLFHSLTGSITCTC